MLELCIENIEDIYIAEKNKDIVERIELNSALCLGGLTPNIDLLKKARSITDIPIICMLRLRAGSFIYSKDEMSIMLATAKKMMPYCDGFAFGALDKDFNIDIKNTTKILNLCKKYNKQFVFHRAIDITSDYFKSVKILDDLKVTRILTSGHEKTCVLGFENIKKLKTNCEILIGSGIDEKNIEQFKDFSIHGSFSKKSKDFFSSHLKLDEEKLNKIREILLNKKQKALFIHGAGKNASHIDGNSVQDITEEYELYNFRYNQDVYIKKNIQDLLKYYGNDIQLYGEDAVKIIVNHKFKENEFKYVCGHSVGAYNVLRAYAIGYTDYYQTFENIKKIERKDIINSVKEIVSGDLDINSTINAIKKHYMPQKADLLELGAPRVDEIEKYIFEASKNANFILIELIEDDKLKFDFNLEAIAILQYGDRSVEKFNEVFKDKILPKNVFVLKIRKVEHGENYLDNIIVNHANLMRKDTKIYSKIKNTRKKIVDIIKNTSFNYEKKLEEIKNIVDEFNYWQKY